MLKEPEKEAANGLDGGLKIIKIPSETLKFLGWLVKQDVTLPGLIVDYLKWENFSKEEIKRHFHVLHRAYIEIENK